MNGDDANKKDITKNGDKSDANMNSTKPKLFAYKKKLKLIKDANSAISEMRKYLNKNSASNTSEELPHDKHEEVHEDQSRDDHKHGDDIHADENIVLSSIKSAPSQPPSPLWEAVRILSEKTGLVSSEEGFINIKPLVNLTVNTLGLFDDVPDEKDKPFDPNDPKTVLKSIFQIWNPRVSETVSQT